MPCLLVLFGDGVAFLVGGDGFSLFLDDWRRVEGSIFYLEPLFPLVVRQIFVEEIFLLLENTLNISLLKSLFLLFRTILRELRWRSDRATIGSFYDITDLFSYICVMWVLGHDGLCECVGEDRIDALGVISFIFFAE